MSKFILSAFADEICADLKTQMDVLEQHDIHHIEMRNVNGNGIVWQTLEQAKEIKKQMDARGFKVSAVGSPIGKIKITEDFAPHMERFLYTLEIAKALETQYIRMFSFFIPEGEDAAIYREEVMDRLGQMVKATEGSGIILAHENEKDIYGDTPERCLDIVKTMNSPSMKLIFDPANYIQCGVETYPKAYQMLKEHIAYMHIKDALHKDGSVMPAGHGDGHIAEILKDLYDSGFESYLSLEPHLGSFEGFAGLELNLDISKLPEGGPGTFMVAATALKTVISKILK